MRARRARADVPIAERISARVTHHGEGPFWDAANRRLLVMDVLAAEIVAVDSFGSFSRHGVPSRVVTVVRRRKCGGFVIGTENGLIGADEEMSAFEPIVTLLNDPTCRTNDGGCDPLGGFVIGTMGYDQRSGAGTVYRIGPDHQVVELLSSVSISNGVQWSADGSRAYYIDTPTKRVAVFDVDPMTGTWSGRRTHISLEDAAGYPDGMAIDDEDGLWVARWGGGAVNHYDAAGRLVETVTVPGVTQVSSCAFGGVQRDVLYITTSREGLADDREPSAGAIFAVSTGSRGPVVEAFAG
jgi:sugar lactone lactonase YvrE